MDIETLKIHEQEYCKSQCNLKDEDMLNKHGELCDQCPMKGFIEYVDDLRIKAKTIPTTNEACVGKSTCGGCDPSCSAYK